MSAFPLSSRTRQGCLQSTFLFNIVLEVLISAIRQEKEIIGIQFETKEVKLSLVTDDTTVYKNKTKKIHEMCKKALELTSKFSKVEGQELTQCTKCISTP